MPHEYEMCKQNSGQQTQREDIWNTYTQTGKYSNGPYMNWVGECELDSSGSWEGHIMKMAMNIKSSMKGAEFVDELHNYYLLPKIVSAPCSELTLDCFPESFVF